MEPSSAIRCYVCQFTDTNDLRYGEWMTKSNISVHLFCLYFSRDLAQTGETELSGICRFLLRDIKNLHKKSASIKCTICSKPYASVYCSGAFCAARVHLVCAIRQQYLLQFRGAFRVFCPRHHPESFDAYGANQQMERDCRICLDPLPEVYDVINVIKACCAPMWFHTDCVRRFALSAGYYFGCLCCRETKTYIQHAEEWGVYVPQREAKWENKSHYAGLSTLNNVCQADECFSNDRKKGTTKNPLLVCRLCGSFRAHLHCARSAHNDEVTADNFACAICKKTQEEVANSQQMASQLEEGIARQEEEEEEDVDMYSSSLHSDDEDKDLMNQAFYIESDNEMDDYNVIVISSESEGERI